jgi:hypothetical protein
VRPKPPPAPISRRDVALMASIVVTDLGCAQRSGAPQASVAGGSVREEPPLRAGKTAQTLRELLAENRKLDPEYGSGLSNHRSMALSALSWLGADDARLRAFAAARVGRYRPLRAAAPLPSADFRSGLGVPSSLVGLIDYFEDALAVEGRDAVLRRVLPELMPGLSGAAFHGLIRTAYALDAVDAAELAHALAYFASVAEPLRPLPEPSAGETHSVEVLLRRVEADPRFRAPRRFVLVTPALRAAAELPGFDDSVAALKLHQQTLDDIARGALEVYLGTRDFIALHGLTATHALHKLLPYLSEPQLALRFHFQALLAAFISVPERQLRAPTRAHPPEWAPLVARALSSDDEHDIKLVYSCYDEGSVRDPLGYREAAALRLGL